MALSLIKLPESPNTKASDGPDEGRPESPVKVLNGGLHRISMHPRSKNPLIYCAHN